MPVNAMRLPDSMIRNVNGVHGDVGAQWLDDLPALLESLCNTWDLRELSPFPNLSYNYVASALRDGEEVVIKAGVPGTEIRTEVEALRIYDGRGVARLIASSPEHGALLIERVRPGRPLTLTENDERRTAVVASMIRRIRTPLPESHGLPTLGEWGRALLEATPCSTPLPASLLERAQRIFVELIESSDEQVLLHGDLHHDNILEAEREPWLVIDPKGIAGDPVYEVATLFSNPCDISRSPELKSITARRVDQLSEETGFERSRIVSWGFVHALLSACWHVEDGSDGLEKSLSIAEVMSEI